MFLNIIGNCKCNSIIKTFFFFLRYLMINLPLYFPRCNPRRSPPCPPSCHLSRLHKHLVSARKFQTKIRAFVNLNTFHLSLSILPALTSTQTFGQCQKILEKIRAFVNLNTFHLSLSILPALTSTQNNGECQEILDKNL